MCHQGLLGSLVCWEVRREQQDRAHPTIPARSGAAGSTRAAPAPDTGLAPPRDGMLLANRRVCPMDQQATASRGLHQKQLPRARFSAGCSPHSPAGSLSPRYSGTAAAPGCSSVPHSHSQSPRSGMLPGALHRAADKPCSFAQAWQAIPFFHVFHIQGNYLVSIRAYEALKAIQYFLSQTQMSSLDYTSFSSALLVFTSYPLS